jgi:SulP family sulfate permease
MVSLVQDHGEQYLFATVVLMGILQILAGVFKLGKFIRLVPYPVMLGFVNGLAIVIFLAQLQHFKQADGSWLITTELATILALVIATMLIMALLPKLTTKVPSALVSIIIISGIVIIFGVETKTVADMASIKGGLPSFHIPLVPINWETLQIIFPYALILAAIGLIESLLTITVIDEMTKTQGRNSRECLAQGFANVTTGFFGGMGGCAMIGQSMININSGGMGRLSGITAAIFLLLFILFASSLIEQIPIAALVGVMFMVVIATFEWSSFRLLKQMPTADSLVLIIVSVVTVLTDLAVAVVVGVIVAALVFAWESARHIYLEIDKNNSDANKIFYILHGQLFFGSIASFKGLFKPEAEPDNIVLDFKYSRVWDHSALDAIETLVSDYEKAGKKLTIRHLSDDCRKFLKKANASVQQDVDTDPHYQVVIDRSYKPQD